MLHRQPERSAERRVERQQLELFIEQHNHQQRDAAQRRHGQDLVLHQCRRLTKQVFVQPGLAGMAVVLDIGQQYDSEAEEDSQHDAECRVFADARFAYQAQNDQRRQPAGQTGADQQHDRRFGAGEQVGDADTGQRSMGEGVAQQRLAPQQRKRAEYSADNAQDRRAERDIAQRIVRY